MTIATIVASEMVEGVAGCSITTQKVDGSFVTAATVNRLAFDLDAVQYDHGGPCVEAARSGVPQRIDSVATDSRWLAFAATAKSFEVRSSFSVPLEEAVRSSAMNFYSKDENNFLLAEPVGSAETVARVIAVMLDETEGYDGTLLDVPFDEMRRVLEDRTTILRARDGLVASRGWPAVDAYRELAQRSVRERRRLSLVARDVLDELGGSSRPPAG